MLLRVFIEILSRKLLKNESLKEVFQLILEDSLAKGIAVTKYTSERLLGKQSCGYSFGFGCRKILLSSLQGTIEMERNANFIYLSHSFAKSLWGAVKAGIFPGSGNRIGILSPSIYNMFHFL